VTGPPGAPLPAWDHDEELIANLRADSAPRACAYAWPPAGAPGVAVVVGRGGDPTVEVAGDAARADGVPVLRRRGGGCAVVLDPGNVIVSLALPLAGVGGITGAFAAISTWLIGALGRCGLPGARQEGTSDLALAGRKIGGSCLWRTKGLVYYSTTLLVAPDFALAERYLPHPPREPAYRAGRPHRDFMGALRELDSALTPTELVRRLSPFLRELPRPDRPHA
jgi:lipoate-protein ligase A